jgi:heterodisulfide reductase subunit C
LPAENNISNISSIDWGFAIQKDRQIDYDKNDRRLVAYIRKFEPTYSLCISCGACTATCSAANFTEFFNIRKLNLLLSRGEMEEIREHVAKCMNCGKCVLVCPRGVNTRKVLIIMKEAIEKMKR